MKCQVTWYKKQVTKGHLAHPGAVGMEASRGVDVGADLVRGEVAVIGDVEWQQKDV